MKVSRVTVKQLLVQVMIVILTVGGVRAADADVLYEQPVTEESLGGIRSQNAPNAFGDGYLAFDNFSLSMDALITGLEWHGTYSTPGLRGTITHFEITFWSDDAGLPGEPLQNYVITGNAGEEFVDGSSAALAFRYHTELPTPFEADANTTYWLSIQPTLNFPPQWSWRQGLGGDGLAAQIVRSISPDPSLLRIDLAFALLGVPASNEISVSLDIKPGSSENSVNPNSRGRIPVTILTTETFDASTVDPTSVRFGSTGTEAAPVHWALEDVDGDGDLDLILHFNTQETGILCGDTSASLTGETFSGQAIGGSDAITTVGCQ